MSSCPFADLASPPTCNHVWVGRQWVHRLSGEVFYCQGGCQRIVTDRDLILSERGRPCDVIPASGPELQINPWLDWMLGINTSTRTAVHF